MESISKKTNQNKQLKTLAKKLTVAGDPNRLKILCTIYNSRDSCVSDIADKLGLSVAITSHHLQTLTKKGLVESKRDGKRICFRLSKDPFITDLKHLICKYNIK